MDSGAVMAQVIVGAGHGQVAALVGEAGVLQAHAALPEAAQHGGLAHLQAAEFLYEWNLQSSRFARVRNATRRVVA